MSLKTNRIWTRTRAEAEALKRWWAIYGQRGLTPSVGNDAESQIQWQIYKLVCFWETIIKTSAHQKSHSPSPSLAPIQHEGHAIWYNIVIRPFYPHEPLYTLANTSYLFIFLKQFAVTNSALPPQDAKIFRTSLGNSIFSEVMDTHMDDTALEQQLHRCFLVVRLTNVRRWIHVSVAHPSPADVSWGANIVLIAALVYTDYFRYTNPLLVRVFSDSFFTCRQSVASSTLIVSVKVELIRATR